MTIKEYLHQTYRLNQRINAHLEECQALRCLATSISSFSGGEKVRSSRSKEAPFVRQIEKILFLEERMNADIDLLLELKEQIHTLIQTLNDPEEQLIIRYRYILGYHWEAIAGTLGMGVSSVHRKHRAALEKLKLPEQYIRI